MRNAKLICLFIILWTVAAFATNVSTTFPAPAENPISQGNNWTNASGSWGAVQTSTGLGFGVSQPTQFGDATAIYKGSWGPSQTVQGTVRIVTSGSNIREVELRGRTTFVNATTINGYEFLCSVSTGATGQYGCQFVRWNGAAGSFTRIASVNLGHVVNGDIMKMVFSGTGVQTFLNGSIMTWNREPDCGNNSGANQTTLDLTCPASGGAIYQSGSPGMGFYRDPAGNDSQFAQYGFSAWSASDEIAAASCSTVNVNTAIGLAFTGDTVTIPSGSCNWTGMNFTKAITLQGAGIGVTNITATGQNTFTNSTVGVMRFTNMTWNNGGLGGPPYAWFIGSGGNWKTAYPIVYQNMQFVTPWVTTHSGSDTTSNFRVERAGGVIWAHDDFQCGWDCDFIQFKDPGDSSGSWTNADTFGIRDAAGTLTGTIPGTSGFLNFYLEDNTFTGGSNQGIDCDDGCRMVARNNIFTNSELNSHGFDTSAWGERHSEIYNNQFKNTCSEATSQNQANCEEFGLGNSSRSNVSQQIWLRGGTHIIYNNQMENASNTWWGTKPQVRMNIRAVSQPSLIGVTCPNLTYPVPRGLGQNTNGTTAFTDPIYFYNNTVKVQGGSGSNWSLAQINEAGTDWPNDNFCNAQIANFSSVYFQSPRDVVNLSLKLGTAKPGYTAFTYPHPLVSGVVATTPDATLTPSSGAFGSLDQGTSGAPQNFTLTSTGTANLNITSITLTGANPTSWRQTNDCPIALAPTAFCTISVTFTPTTTGARAATLSVATNAVSGTKTSTLTGTGTSCTAPNPFPCARTDYLIIPKPATPNMGGLNGRGTIITEPDFGERIVRVTDASLSSGALNVSYVISNGGSLDDTWWNTNSTKFLIQPVAGTVIPMNFNPTTMAATPTYPASNLQRIPAQAAQMSTVDPNKVWGLNNTTWQTWDLGSPTFPVGQTFIDLTAAGPNCLPGGFALTHVGMSAVSDNDAVLPANFSNTGGQNTDAFVVVYVMGKGCMVINTVTGAITADPGFNGGTGLSCDLVSCTGTLNVPTDILCANTPVCPNRFTIHNVKINKDGTLLMLAVGQCQPVGGCGNNSSPYVWQIGTNIVTYTCGEANAGTCGGHSTIGQSHYSNRDGSPAYQFNLRPVLSPSGPIVGQVPPPGPTTYLGPMDYHPAWTAGNLADTFPILLMFAPFQFDATITAPRSVWWQEVVAMDPLGVQIPWRLGRSWTSGVNWNFDSQNAIGAWSQDGRFYSFTSDWMGTLGGTTGAATCVVDGTQTTGCRNDVFIMDLREAVVTPPSVNKINVKGNVVIKGNVTNH